MNNNNDELRLKTDRKLSMGYILKRNLKYLKPEIGNLILSMVFMILNVFLGLQSPLIIGEVIKILKVEDAVIDFDRILLCAIVYFAIGILSQVFRFIQAMILQHSGQKIVYDMRMEVFSHIENMSQNQFN